jgi:Uma2 family endonuclease
MLGSSKAISQPILEVMMIGAMAPAATQPLFLDISGTTLHVTAVEFDRLCQRNPDLRLELTKDGELIVMPPTGGESGRRNLKLASQVCVWNDRTELGEAFDSSTGYDFTAIGGGKLSPDVSWIEQSRLIGVNITGFIPVVPDFIIELRSATDSLSATRTKMSEYNRLGVRLGLLVNPQDKQVEIYRLAQDVEILDSPDAIDCSDVMPEFSLRMEKIW